MKFVLVVLCYGILQFSEGNTIHETTTELQNDAEMITAGVETVIVEVEDAMRKYKKKKDEEFGGHQSNDYNILQMYEWYEKEGDKATKKCLSAQRTLQMIRTGYKENVNQCLTRVDLIVIKMEDKIKSLVKMAEKHANIVDLVVPCKDLNVPDECLAQAKEQAKLRTESMIAALQRFDIFKKLKIYEIDTIYDVCHSITEAYKNCERDEIEVLRKCMLGEDDHDQQDRFKVKRKN